MWKIAMVPIIGAIIGYATNWIAVKMLFRPRHEIYIGKFKLPFTPGVIPKGQPRLARAIGKIVETELITTEVMKNLLLSDDIKEKLTQAVTEWVDEKRKSDRTVRQVALDYMDEESWSELKAYVMEEGGEYIFKKIMEIDPGKVITEKVVEAANEKLAESVLGAMLGGGLVESVAGMAEEKINEYLNLHGEEYIERAIEKEENIIQEKTVGSFVTSAQDNGLDMPLLVLSIYEEMIEKHIETVMKNLNLTKVVENQINSMKVEELEELVLAIMSKELGAIVNLGALIGFVLGLVNVAILSI